MDQNTIIGDQPVETIEDDVFGYFTKSAAKLADEILMRKTPLAVSVTGGWGEGKTSMLNLILFCIEYRIENQDSQENCVDLCFNLWERTRKKKDSQDIRVVERILMSLQDGSTSIPIVRFNAWKYHDAPDIAMLTVFAESIGEWVNKTKIENLKKLIRNELELDKNDYIEILKSDEELSKEIFERIQRNISPNVREKLQKKYKEIPKGILEEIEESNNFGEIFRKIRKNDSVFLRDLLGSEIENHLAEIVSVNMWEIAGNEKDEIDCETKKEIIKKISKKITSDKTIKKLDNLIMKEKIRFRFKKLKKKVKSFLESKDNLMEAIHSLGLTHERIMKGLSVASTLAFGIPIPEEVQKIPGNLIKGEIGEKKRKIEKDEIIQTLEALSDFDRNLTKKGMLSIMKIERIAKELIDRAKKMFESKNFRVVLVIDDLDRALADHIFRVFETMKTYLDIAGLVIVAAYSPEYVEKALEKVMEEKETIDPKEYLEKLFQINHRIERREITYSQFLGLVEDILNKKITEMERGSDLIPIFGHAFVKFMNNFKISPRNLKRVLIKADEVCGHLSKEHQKDDFYVYASTFYSFLDLFAPRYLDMLKEEMSIKIEWERMTTLEEIWDMETIISAVNIDKIEEKERKIVEKMSSLKEMRPTASISFTEALVDILLIMKTGKVPELGKRPEPVEILDPTEIKDAFTESLTKLLNFCIRNGIPLEIKNVLNGEDFFSENFQLEKVEKPVTRHRSIVLFKDKPGKKILAFLDVNFSTRGLWGSLNEMINISLEMNCNEMKLIGIFHEKMDSMKKEEIHGMIDQKLLRLSQDLQDSIKFCITDLPTFFESLTEAYNIAEPKYKKYLANYMAAIVIVL